MAALIKLQFLKRREMAVQALQNMFSEYLKTKNVFKKNDLLIVCCLNYHDITIHACSVFDRHLELGSNLQSESAIRICNSNLQSEFAIRICD